MALIALYIRLAAKVSLRFIPLFFGYVWDLRLLFWRYAAVCVVCVALVRLVDLAMQKEKKKEKKKKKEKNALEKKSQVRYEIAWMDFGAKQVESDHSE